MRFSNKVLAIITAFIFPIFLQIVAEDSYKEESVVLQTPVGSVYGTLLLPNTINNHVALIISGSGPTDRNGNQPNLVNNSLKMLAESLYSHGIASLRYDKRAIAESKIDNLSESDIRFEHYVQDAAAWSTWLKGNDRFNNITIVGHSEGSLVGMLAANEVDIDKFVSLAGPGKSADKVIKEQLGSKRVVSYFAFPLIDDLVQGKTVNPPFFLKTLFRPTVQPYLISWFKYDPSVEIKKLKVPCLVIQGTTDIQVKVKDALLLANANKRVSLKIIEGMNHILKNTPLEQKENLKSYNRPDLPVNAELIREIVNFVKL